MIKTKKLITVVMVALTLVAPVFGLFPPSQGRAAAAVTGSFTDAPDLQSQVLAHQSYYFLMNCFGNNNMDYVPNNEVRSWEWLKFGNVSLKSSTSSTLGAMYNPSEIDCADGGSVSKAFAAFGITDPVDAFCSLSFTFTQHYGGLGGGGDNNAPRTKQSCLSGISSGDGADGAGSNGQQTAAIDALLSTSPNYSNAKGSLSPAANFIRAYETLMNGCKVALTDTYNNAKDPAAHNAALFKVPVVTGGSGAITYALGQLGQNVNANNIHLIGTENSSPWQDTSCTQLAADARNSAADYQKYLSDNNLSAANATTNPSVDGGTNSTQVDTSCGNKQWVLKLLNPLDWLTCAVVGGFSTVAQYLDNGITSLLCINESKVFGATSTCSAAGTSNLDSTSSTTSTPSGRAFHDAWNSFRILALGIIVVAGLLMVISQGLGFEVFDAYTVKKTLPRILIAGIGITLSWQLLMFLVTLSNGLGIGIRALIYAPFKNAGFTTVVLQGGGQAILTLFGGAAFVALGALGLLSFLGTALLAALIAFVLLVIRYILVVLLIIVAPVAIALYCLPNTEKYFKAWWDWILKALMIFPIITAFIAIGHVFAAITSNNADQSSMGTINSFVAFVAYFAPYFAIPFAFKLAGGAIGTIGGMVNDRGRGGFDRLKKYRQNTMGHRNQEWRSGSLHGRGYNALGINNLGRRVNAGFRGRYGFGERGQSLLATDAGVQATTALKNNPRLQQFAMTNDDGNAVLALSGGTHAGAHAAAEQLFGDDHERAQRAIRSAASIGFTRENAGAALNGLAQNKSRAIGVGRDDIVRDGIARLAGNNNQLNDDLVGTFAFNSRQAGRADLGGMNWGLRGDRDGSNLAQFNAQREAYAQRLAGGGPVTAEHHRQAMADLSMLDGMGRTKAPEIVGGHTAGMQGAVNTALRMLEHGDEGQRQQAAARLLEFHQNRTAGSADNTNIINQAMAQAGVNYDGANGTVTSQLAEIVGMDANALARSARIYGDEIPPNERGGGQPQQPQNPEV